MKEFLKYVAAKLDAQDASVLLEKGNVKFLMGNQWCRIKDGTLVNLADNLVNHSSVGQAAACELMSVEEIEKISAKVNCNK